MSKQGVESNRPLAKNETYVAISKKWLFDLTGLHFAPNKGIVLADVGRGVKDLDKIATKELGKGVRHPE